MSLSPSERERLDALVAAYRKLPRAEPSAEVDAAVLRGARDALRTRTRPRWPALLATAATMTLAVGLAWQLREAEDRIEAERPATSSAPSVAPAAPPVAYEESVAGSRDANADPARADRAAPLEDASAPPPEPQARSELGAVAGADARSAADNDAAGGPRAEVTAGELPARRARERPDAPVREPKLAREQDATQAKAEARRIEAPAPAEPSSEFATDEVLLESVPAPASARPPEPFPDDGQPPAPPASPAPPPPAAPEAARAPAAAVAAPVLKKQVESSAERERAERERGAHVERGIGQAQRAERAAALRDPDDWLAEILRLLRAGERTRAIESLREFRETYPEVELPRELRDLTP